MRITTLVNTSPKQVFKSYAYTGVIFGLLTPLFVLNSRYSSGELNKAKWKGVGLGVICHFAVWFIYRIILYTVVRILRLFSLFDSASHVKGVVVFLIYCVSCAAVIGIMHIIFKKKRI